MLKKYILIIVALFTFCKVCFSQKNSMIGLNSNKPDSPYAIEKLYLHTDRINYDQGDTIWFKAYAVESPSNKPSEISKVLYTELTNGDSLIKRLTLQLDPGIAWGDFALPANCKTGIYHLRAYTNWMRNDSKTFFEQEITVGHPILKKALQTESISQQNPEPKKPGIHFFPEGGNLVNGLRSRVVIKVTENTSLLPMHGVVVDSENKEVASFTTNPEGFAQFALTPQQGDQYSANLSLSNGNNYAASLPAAKSDGFVLTMNNSDSDIIRIKISLSEGAFKKLKNTSVYLTGLSAGEVYYSTAIRIDSRVFSASVDKNRFPSGVAQFSLISSSGEIYHERLIFIENKNQLTLKIDTANTRLTSGKKIKFNLNARDPRGLGVIGSFSVSVTQENDTLGHKENILSYLLLQSNIETTTNLFDLYTRDLGKDNSPDLDMLMIAAHYKRPDLKKLLSDSVYRPVYPPQTSLGLSGTATSKYGKPVAGRKIRLSSVKDFFVADTVTDMNGNFTFSNLELADSTKVFIGVQKAKGNDNIKITVKEPKYPQTYVYSEVNPQIYTETANNRQSLKEANTATPYSGTADSLPKTRRLKEVVIKSYKNKRNNFFQPKFDDNIKRSVNLNGPGNADEVILAENIPFKGSLADALPGRTAGLISWQNGTPFQNGTPGGSRQSMMILLEGAVISPTELQSINVSDVYSIELLRHQNFTSIYGSDGKNGIMIITMRHGTQKSPDEVKVDNGSISYLFKGFNTPDKFNLKDFQSSTVQHTAQSKTIYWEPNLVTDNQGNASFELINPLNKGNYRITIEGIDGDGQLGTLTYWYNN